VEIAAFNKRIVEKRLNNCVINWRGKNTTVAQSGVEILRNHASPIRRFFFPSWTIIAVVVVRKDYGAVLLGACILVKDRVKMLQLIKP